MPCGVRIIISANKNAIENYGDEIETSVITKEGLLTEHLDFSTSQFNVRRKRKHSNTKYFSPFRDIVGPKYLGGVIVSPSAFSDAPP